MGVRQYKLGYAHGLLAIGVFTRPHRFRGKPYDRKSDERAYQQGYHDGLKERAHREEMRKKYEGKSNASLGSETKA